MARLSTLRPQLAALPGRLDRPGQTRDQERADRLSYRAWYGSTAWRTLSIEVRVEAAFTCGKCGRIDGRPGQMVADHRIPHRGDPALFWDRGNLWALCKSCHDGAKQKEERAAP